MSADELWQSEPWRLLEAESPEMVHVASDDTRTLCYVGVCWHNGNASQAVYCITIYLFDVWVSEKVSLPYHVMVSAINSPCALLQNVELG